MSLEGVPHKKVEKGDLPPDEAREELAKMLKELEGLQGERDKEK